MLFFSSLHQQIKKKKNNILGNRETEAKVKEREETLTSEPEERIELPVISANKRCHIGDNETRLGCQ